MREGCRAGQDLNDEIARDWQVIDWFSLGLFLKKFG